MVMGLDCRGGTCNDGSPGGYWIGTFVVESIIL
jgi:hypothetical protein